MESRVKALLFMPGILALALSTGYRALAQDSASKPIRQLKTTSQPAVYDDSQPFSDQDFQLLRKDLRSQKKQIVAANMAFTDVEAEEFWPVYDRYAADLSKIYDTKMAIIEEYLDNYQTMNGKVGQVESSHSDCGGVSLGVRCNPDLERKRSPEYFSAWLSPFLANEASSN